MYVYVVLGFVAVLSQSDARTVCMCQALWAVFCQSDASLLCVLGFNLWLFSPVSLVCVCECE